MIPGGGSKQRRDTIASQNYNMTAGRIMRQALICFILLAVTPIGAQAATARLSLSSAKIDPATI